MPNQHELTTPIMPTWCPGCGDFGIWTAFKNACEKENWSNENTAIVAGIGCHGHIINFVNLTSFEGLHGRALPVAGGIKMANHKLNVFVFTGDGDSLAEGGNHFMHAARRNQNFTVILHDNAIYGLTTGQTSPRSPKGFKTKSTPQGNLEEPLQPLRMALAAGATFLARGYAGDIPFLTDLMIKANNHEGLAIIQVLQPCVTFNQEYTHIWYQRNMYKLGPDHDVTSKTAAYAKLLEWGEKQIPVGIFYQVEEPSYEAQIKQIHDKSLLEQGALKREIAPVLKKYF
jgi:2-oxoglutarate ferredoxin oxidoreductase subunit beta